MLLLLFAGARRRRVGWDTSDPLFYNFWRKVQARERARRIKPKPEPAQTPTEEKREVVKATSAPSREIISALAGVQSISDLEALRPLDTAYIGRLMSEYEQARKQAEQEDDDLETLLLVMLA